jgi:hypothetical protein
MKNKLISPLELVKLLVEKGFGEELLGNLCINTLQTWLREAKRLIVVVEVDFDGYFYSRIYILEDGRGKLLIPGTQHCSTYNEALMLGIEKALKLI